MASEGTERFQDWPKDDQAQFKQHYDAALAKSDEHEAKLISDFDVMKALMIKNRVATTSTLAPHLVGISPANRDGKIMVADEMMMKGKK